MEHNRAHHLAVVFPVRDCSLDAVSPLICKQARHTLFLILLRLSIPAANMVVVPLPFASTFSFVVRDTGPPFSWRFPFELVRRGWEAVPARLGLLLGTSASR